MPSTSPHSTQWPPHVDSRPLEAGKRHFGGWLALAAMVLGLGLAPDAAQAYPLNPWGAKTTDKNLSINPFLYVYPGGEIYPVVYLGYGLSERWDVMVGGGTGIASGSGVGGTWLELFPRFFVTEQLALVPHVYFTPGDSLIVAPELHMAVAKENFALTVNLAYKPRLGLDGSGPSAGSAVALVAPEVIVNDRLSFYLEVNPTVSLEGADPGLVLVPGVGFNLGADGQHVFSVGLQLDVSDGGISPSVGAWYSYAFDLSGK